MCVVSFCVYACIMMIYVLHMYVTCMYVFVYDSREGGLEKQGGTGERELEKGGWERAKRERERERER